MCRYPSIDVVPTVANDPNIVVGEVWQMETYVVGAAAEQHLRRPFNNVKKESQALWPICRTSTEYMKKPMRSENLAEMLRLLGSAASPNGHRDRDRRTFHFPNLDKATPADDRVRLKGRERGRADRRPPSAGPTNILSR